MVSPEHGCRGLKAFSFAHLHLERTFDLAYGEADIVLLVTTGRLPGATIPERMAALREVYAEGYVPQDEDTARRLLEENGVPPFSSLGFSPTRPSWRRRISPERSGRVSGRR